MMRGMQSLEIHPMRSRIGVLRNVPGLLLAVFACAASAQTAGTPSHPLRVLMIGNSYLYTNDLPQTLAALAAQHGVVLETVLRAEPDFSLADHLHHRRLGSMLEQEWDWIVLQQGPSALPDSRRELQRSVRKFAARLRERPVRIALFSAWPAQRNRAMSEDAEISYRLAAQQIHACVLPVATAWRYAMIEADVPHLYHRDGLHPTRAGTLLAAMTTLRGLMSSAPASLAPTLPDVTQDESRRLAALDAASLRAHQAEARRCE